MACQFFDMLYWCVSVIDLSYFSNKSGILLQQVLLCYEYNFFDL